MNEIIDFKTEAMKKGTDLDCQITMPDGSTWFKYSAIYSFQCHKGEGLSENILKTSSLTFSKNTYSIDFWAMSDEDAENRVKAMRENIHLEGRIVG